MLKQIKEWKRAQTFFSVIRHPGCGGVICGSSEGKLYGFAIDSEATELAESDVFEGHSGYVAGLAKINDSTIVSGASDGRLCWWNLSDHSLLRGLEAHTKWTRRVLVSPDGTVVASLGDDMVCRIWDSSSGTLIRELRGHAPKTPHHFPSMLYAGAISADGRLLATGDRVGHIVVWELGTGRQLASLEAPIMYTWDPKQRIHSIGGLRSLAFSPDGSRLVAGGMGPVGNIDHLEGLARIEIFDWQKSERLCELAGDTFKGLVEQILFDPTGKWFAAGGGDHTGFIKIVELDTGKLVAQEKVPMHVHDMAWLEEPSSLITVGNGRLVSWNLQS